MQENYFEYKIPSFAKEEVSNFEPIVKEDNPSIYEELNAISEEIEKCRLQNC